jgi:hypothetical protein
VSQKYTSAVFYTTSKKGIKYVWRDIKSTNT